jgi:asparagine synthetase B (glutamine-hydrolysing)
MKSPHLFLPLRVVLHHRQLRKQLHPVYQDACRFFSCTLIDRTQTLETGLEFQILDPLEGLTPTSENFDKICDQVGDQVVRQAVAAGKTVQLLWSGGIDSTTALVAIYKALEREDRLDTLHVLLSQESVQEYQRFFAEVIHPHLHYTIFKPPLYPYLDPQCLVVTGEHGDQLFGSDKLRPFVWSGEAFRRVAGEGTVTYGGAV